MPADSVDLALAEDADDLGPALLELPEDQRFDRKSSRINPKKIGLALVAFANAEGERS